MPDQNETLDDLEAEIDAEALNDAEFEGEDDLGEGQTAHEYRAPDPQMAQIISGAFLAVGNVVCARKKVTPISQAEADAVGSAGADVMAFYDFQPSGKAGAWLGLAIAVAAVSIPRLKEAASVIDAETEPPDAGAPVFDPLNMPADPF